MSAVLNSLRKFVDIYHQADQLTKDYDNWNCNIALVSTDSNETVHLQVENGLVWRLGESLDDIDLTVTAETEILLDILELRRDPNEPYMFGELTVQGEEEHFMRLDYIVSMLCPV